jgi:hypothetical protein
MFKLSIREDNSIMQNPLSSRRGKSMTERTAKNGGERFNETSSRYL